MAVINPKVSSTSGRRNSYRPGLADLDSEPVNTFETMPYD